MSGLDSAIAVGGRGTSTGDHGPREWTARGACARPGVDPDLFHPADGEHYSRRRARVAAARGVCAQCPLDVRRTCIDDAIAAGDWWGVRGGLTGDELARLASRRKRGLDSGAVAVLATGSTNGFAGSTGQVRAVDADPDTLPDGFADEDAGQLLARLLAGQWPDGVRIPTAVCTAAVAALHGEGCDDQAIAARTGLHARTVFGHRKRLGLPSWRAGGRWRTADEVATLTAQRDRSDADAEGVAS